MLILAPLLSQVANWQAVWWFGCAYALVVTVLFLIFVKPVSNATPTDRLPSTPLPMAQVLRNRDVWLISLAFAFFLMATMSSGTFLPTYLSTVRGMPLAQAALLSSVVSMVTIFSCPAGGILSDRIGSRKRPYMLGLVLMAFAMPLMAFINSNALIILVVVQGLISGLVPTNIFSAGVEVVGDERLGGLVMGVIMAGQNAGMLVGPIVFGLLVESAGWSLAFGSLAIMCLVGAAAGWLAKAR